MKKIILACIALYQKTLSPDHGFLKHHPSSLVWRCRFYPSCSEYARQAIVAQGVIKGGIMSFKRVARCRPGVSGGVDLVR